MNKSNMIQLSDYGIFENIYKGIPIVIRTDEITKENLGEYYSGLLNVFRDSIDDENLHRTFIKFIFSDGTDIELTTNDALINICMWGFIVETGGKIMPKHVFFEEKGITAKAIKNYIDNFCIIPNVYNKETNLYELSNIIYTTLRRLSFVDDFAMFFNNSINLEDFIDMALACPEFDEILHKDYTNIPVDSMNNEALKDTNRLIELILDSKKIMGREHCLIDAFRAQEGIKAKQFREFAVNIGVKPNGEGGVNPYTIDSSYINGGLYLIAWMIAESAIGRLAQVIVKKNTADSGAFARILGLNSIDTFLYCKPGTGIPDPEYDCHTRNFTKFTVDSFTKLKMITDCYYRMDPNGMEYNVGHSDTVTKDHPLMGKTIFLRTPMKCASNSKGLGICRKCYSELFLVNKDINVGKNAAESISAPLTQTMLSSKHLLEAKVYSVTWDGNYEEFIVVEDNNVYINPDAPNPKEWSVVIKMDSINTENVLDLNDDDDSDDYDEDLEMSKEYINSFTLVSSSGDTIEVHTTKYDNLYITSEFSSLIHQKEYVNFDTIEVPLDILIEQQTAMLEIGIYNDDMGNKLKAIMNTINLKAVTESFEIDEFFNTFIDKLIEVGLGNIRAVHAAIILANQIRDKDDILSKPDWDCPNNQNYRILTLRKSLETNPSITVSCQSDNIAKTLYNPLSFKKTKPSVMDLFYHVQPQKFLSSDPEKDAERVRLFTSKPTDLR